MNRSYVFDSFWAVLVLPLVLGITLAWVTTGQLSLWSAALLLTLGTLLLVGSSLLRAWLPFILSPLFFFAVYGILRVGLDWGIVWPLVVVAAFIASLAFLAPLRLPLSPRRRRLGCYLLVCAYLPLCVGVLVGGLPAWTLLGVLTSPSVWKSQRADDNALPHSQHLCPLCAATLLLIWVGYLIQGIL